MSYLTNEKQKAAPSKSGQLHTGQRIKDLATPNFTTNKTKTQYPSIARLDKYLSQMVKAKNPAQYLAAFTSFLSVVEGGRDAKR